MRRTLLAIALFTGCTSSPRPLATAALPPGADDAVNGPLKEAVTAELESLVEAYRWFHQNAELSLKEEKTSARFAEELRKAGWNVTEKLGGFGVLGVLRNGEGPLVLARIDMDGLPVKEETGLPYASASAAMHACGHDSHLAIGVGLARMLPRLKGHWSGTVALVGQPAEELGTGAKSMLEDPKFHAALPGKPVACLSVHDYPSPAGTVGVCPGFASANVDTIDITVHGRGGHGAWPHKTVDPIVVTSEIVLSLQTIVARKLAPGTRAVVTVGSFHAGTKHNIIPDEAKLQLTVRSYEDDAREKLLAEIRQITLKIAEAHRAPKAPSVTSPEVFTPAGYHDPALTARMKAVFERLLGADRVYDADAMMGGEDFSRFPKHWGVPGLQFRVGGARAGHDPEVGLHSSKWSVDPEPTLRAGVSALTRGVIDLLPRK
jgi:hippurate hydrolase